MDWQVQYESHRPTQRTETASSHVLTLTQINMSSYTLTITHTEWSDYQIFSYLSDNWITAQHHALDLYEAWLTQLKANQASVNLCSSLTNAWESAYKHQNGYQLRILALCR